MVSTCFIHHYNNLIWSNQEYLMKSGTSCMQLWKTSTKLKGQNSQFLTNIYNITPMLEIHGPYIFYSSWHHLHLTKSRTSYQVWNILNVTCKNKQHTWQNIGKTFSFWLAFSSSHQCFHTKCLFIYFIIILPPTDRNNRIHSSQKCIRRQPV